MNKMINIKGIVWLNVTRQCQRGETFIQEIMNNFTLFILHDDNTYEQVEFVEEVVEAIALDLKIIIYVGNEKKQSWFHQAKKILKNGYWYVRIADLKL